MGGALASLGRLPWDLGSYMALRALQSSGKQFQALVRACCPMPQPQSQQTRSQEGRGSTERHCWDPSPAAASQLCGHAYFFPFLGSSFQLHKTGLIISNSRVEVVKNKLKSIIFRKQCALGAYMRTQLNVSYLRVLLSLSSTQSEVGDEWG